MTDWALIHKLEKDALKSYVHVAKELGFTPRTVKNRLKRLELKHALIVQPTLDIASIDGMVGLILFYSYTNREMKDPVDQAMLSHFDGSYLWGALTDPEGAYLILTAPNMVSVRQYLRWAKQQQGVASARIEIVVEGVNFWSKAAELFSAPATKFLD